jgi:glycosyltransferase involved in cell wall biosynthesis
MMRILHICQRDDPDAGGSIRVCEALAAEQRAAGLDVWILFLYGTRAGLCDSFSPKTLCLEIHSSRDAFSGLTGLVKTVKRVRPDLIHSHDGIIWPRLMYLFSNIPVVTHAHLPGGLGPGLKNYLGWALIKHTSDCVIGISEHTATSWVDKGYPVNKIELIPNGVDSHRFDIPSEIERTQLREKLGLPENRQILLWVGRLHRAMKGTDRVERVLVCLPEDTTLVVVGQGAERAGLLERCATYVQSHKLILPGSSPNPEEYYKAADAFLFTSYYEPFGLVILEAVACGLPLLAFPVVGGGGASELLQEFDATMIDVEDSSSAVTGAVNVALARRGSTQHLREKAMQTYSWAVLSRQLTQVYETVIADHRRSE